MTDKRNNFSTVGAFEGNEKWHDIIHREVDEKPRTGDIRSQFDIDYNRILYSQAYRRLKSKTQVFFNTNHDHICTRIEHVNLVDSVSYTIAKNLGLNVELTRAIATGHDIGHAPFGHRGEEILNKISIKYLNKQFWHEFNSLRFVDELELLKKSDGKYKNLNLCYGVRDGLVCHCGEKNEQVISPRKEVIKLEELNNINYYIIDKRNKVKNEQKIRTNKPFTWEGCVVRLADSIAYLGRDIEDAIQLQFIGENEIQMYTNILKKYKNYIKGYTGTNVQNLEITNIIHILILDLCKNSTVEDGLKYSDKIYSLYKDLKTKNYDLIYGNPKLDNFKTYAGIVIIKIFEYLYSKSKIIYENINKYDIQKMDNILLEEYIMWVRNYCTIGFDNSSYYYNNKRVYKKFDSDELFIQSIIDYISGMTDHYAIKMYNSLLEF